MGLEDAEIFMDIEDAYAIKIDEATLASWDKTVGHLCELLYPIIDATNPQPYTMLSHGDVYKVLNKKEYNEIAAYTPGIRSVMLLVPERLNTINKINGAIIRRNEGIGSCENISMGIKRIIQERLDLGAPPKDTHHFYKDLGCG